MKAVWLMVSAGVLVAGCASISQGTTQLITFSIDPVEARCDVKGRSGSALGTVTGRNNALQVSKGFGDLMISCHADGFEDKTLKVASNVQMVGLASIFVDLGITDTLTGAMWKYPEQVMIAMDKKSSR